MPSALPAEEAVTLYNRLATIPPSDAEAIGHIEWRLRALARSRLSDPVIAVAHLIALQLLGHAEEAIAAADRIWPMRSLLAPEQLHTFANELVNIGKYERALELVEGLRTLSDSPYLRETEASLAWAIGDMDRMEPILKGASGRAWSLFVEDLHLVGMRPHIAGRQAIVRQKTFGKQCFATLHLLPGIEQRLTMTQSIYVPGPYEDRLALEDEIHAALDDYFVPLGFGDIHWDIAAELILPIGAGIPWAHERQDAA